jgi:hypothetical protein
MFNMSASELPTLNGLKTIYDVDNTLITSVVSITLLSFAVFSILRSRIQPPYPPGPKRLPILGNILNFPKRHFVEVFTQWKEIYGKPLSGFLVRVVY